MAKFYFLLRFSTQNLADAKFRREICYAFSPRNKIFSVKFFCEETRLQVGDNFEEGLLTSGVILPSYLPNRMHLFLLGLINS